VEKSEEILDFGFEGTTIKVSPPIQSGSNGPLARKARPLLGRRPV